MRSVLFIGAALSAASALRKRSALAVSTPVTIDRESCCEEAGNPEICLKAKKEGLHNESSGDKIVLACPNDPDPAKEGQCKFHSCCGAVGRDCEGVTQNISFGPLGDLSLDFVAPIDHGDGTSSVVTAVGSILHDLCCLEHPDGAFCGTFYYPIPSAINLRGIANNNCACLMEWRKAILNTFKGRYWRERLPNGQQTADMTFDPTQLRRSWLPVSASSGFIGPSTWDLAERRATSGLCAPTGTLLDCPGEDQHCRVGCFANVHCVAADSTISRRRDGWSKRWTDDHAHAGDSDYCCSGRFRKVTWSVGSGRWGECA